MNYFYSQHSLIGDRISCSEQDSGDSQFWYIIIEMVRNFWLQIIEKFLSPSSAIDFMNESSNLFLTRQFSIMSTFFIQCSCIFFYPLDETLQ